MPLYEYQCRKCGCRFERLQKVDDAPVTECPDCGGPVDRLLGVPALQFKGSGWYVTDYGRSNGRNDDSGASTGATDGGGEKKIADSGPGAGGTGGDAGKDD